MIIYLKIATAINKSFEIYFWNLVRCVQIQFQYLHLKKHCRYGKKELFTPSEPLAIVAL
jgi:hypothetical protein